MKERTPKERASGLRLAAILWFVAACLAFIAFGIDFGTAEGIDWALAAGGLFCVAMGFSTASRSRSQTPPS